MKAIIAGFVGVIGLTSTSFTGCTENESRAETEIFYGSSVTLHEGLARTYLIMNDEKPVEVGVAITEQFINSLPEDGADGGIITPDGHSVFEYVLELPEENPTPFNHVTLDWNPVGHEPMGIYDRPHFDVHFYLISREERMLINPEDPEFMVKAQRQLSPDFLPVGYIDPGMPPVPMMGVHLVDLSSPELHPEQPEPFTQTFIYGSWDGKLIFAEPMVTIDWLLERQGEERPIGLANRYDPEGYHPGAYAVRWNEETQEHQIALTDFQWK